MSALRRLLIGGLALAALPAAAEPIFLSKQYARCTTCHYTANGGGLLTPYGRSLSREELSTTGRSATPPTERDPKGEHEFLWGALGGATGPVNFGIDLRPSHLDIDVGPRSPNITRDFFMTADLQVAFQKNGFTAYGTFGRQPRSSGTEYDTAVHWVSYESSNGFGIRAGRYMPAYGVNFSDHTNFTRALLGFDTFDQVYGVELSHSRARHLLQVTLSPGRADSIVDDDGRRGFTASARYQRDFSTRASLVVSGIYRNKSRLEPENGSAGLAFGFAPTRRLSIWTQGDASFEQGRSGDPAYTLLNETAFEAFRGVWLKISPQLRTEFGRPSRGVFRMAYEANLLPRTHWNVGVSYYRDKVRSTDLVLKTWLLQLHLYL